MNRTLVVTVAAFALSSAAVAQTEAPPAPLPPEAPAPVEAPASPEVPPAVEAPPSTPATGEDAVVPTVPEQVTGPQDTASVEDTGLLQKQLQALSERTELFDHLEFSGYIQARYVWDEASTPEKVTDGFTVRRGRLKATYELEWSEYVLQIDATGKGLTLKDAEVHLIEPWTGYKLEAVIGQHKYPFGFEVPQSSSKREFPERSRVVRSFLPGERDRGAKLLANIGAVRFMGGVFDGNGVDNKAARGVDNDRFKDVVGRVGFDLKWLAAGVSGWYGQTLRHEEEDDQGVVIPEAVFPRTRIGADVQLVAKLLPFGKTALRWEGITGRTFAQSGVEQFGVPAAGWYAVLVQHLGDRTSIAARYEFFDPLLGTQDEVSSANPNRPASTNSFQNAGVALMYDWNESVELTGALEYPMTRGPVSAGNALLTLQAQARF